MRKKFIFLPFIIGLAFFMLYIFNQDDDFELYNEKYLEYSITNNKIGLRNLISEMNLKGDSSDLNEVWLKIYIYLELEDYAEALNLMKTVYKSKSDYQVLLRICMLESRLKSHNKSCYDNVISEFRKKRSDYYNVDSYWYAVFLSRGYDDLIQSDLHKTSIDKSFLDSLKVKDKDELIYEFFPK
ncbi:hypothetical protein [Pasteurella testudinis]|nr:hypothetical protein [Pasteurella testudinis]SUB52161.1 Uncharacterised protein [Pasteurella testudinis]